MYPLTIYFSHGYFLIFVVKFRRNVFAVLVFGDCLSRIRLPLLRQQFKYSIVSTASLFKKILDPPQTFSFSSAIPPWYQLNFGRCL